MKKTTDIHVDLPLIPVHSDQRLKGKPDCEENISFNKKALIIK
jgi:hypothetical protein